MVVGTEIGLSPGDFTLDGDPAPPPPKGSGAPKFLAHSSCGQMDAAINIAHDMEVRPQRRRLCVR